MNQQMNQMLAGCQKAQEEQQKARQAQLLQLQNMMLAVVGQVHTQVPKRKELEGIDQEFINTQEYDMG